MENQLNSVHLDISRGVIKADAIGFAAFGALYLLLSLFPWHLEAFLWCALLYSPYFIAAFFAYRSSKSHHKSSLECYSVILMIICTWFVLLTITTISLFGYALYEILNYDCDREHNDSCSLGEGVGWFITILLGFMGLLLISSCVLTFFAMAHSNKTIGLLSGKMKNYQQPLIPPAMYPAYPQQMNQDYLR
ncbi:unnamed protein product [Blepharisma stoltei]|uniref:Uncharacterized protein n=1 Tax=Blepharisma stoltei TaxID=1481888 RepID=A0AAU9IUE9_9CILI|nr:unnamed protein product [Blepharisma stoltei]